MVVWGEADDVKPGLICPHQEQNSHHLLGHSMHLVGIHPSAHTGYPTVHAAEIKRLGSRAVRESLCMQIEASTATNKSLSVDYFLSIALRTMQPSQCSAARSVLLCRQALTGGWRAGARNCSWQARPSRALPPARGWEEACGGRQTKWAWFIFGCATRGKS